MRPYAVLAATAIGLIVSALRWMLLDRLHHATGVKRPVWDDRRLNDVIEELASSVARQPAHRLLPVVVLGLAATALLFVALGRRLTARSRRATR